MIHPIRIHKSINSIYFRAFKAVVARMVLAAVIVLFSSLTAPAQSVLRQRTLLDADWLFHRGEVTSSNQVVLPGYADKQWQTVQLPHDYVLDGAYNPTNDRNHGYLSYGVAWYRKHFFIPASDQGKILQLDFDGVYRDSAVWLNGRFLGRHRSGYTPFYYDITKAARYGTENVITVCVDPRLTPEGITNKVGDGINPEQFEGWWYEGGGIYRHVYLTALSPLRVAHWGTYVISKVPHGNEGADGEANLTIQTTIRNDGATPAGCEVVYEIVGPDGKLLKTLKTEKIVIVDRQHEVVEHTVLQHPRLWSLPSPQLYQLHTTVLQNGQPVDAAETTFGIRTILFDVNKGFFLNGEHMEIQGVACHQDFAGVGIAVPDSLQVWRVKRLKEMGCNAWRTAHNPPNEALLDACDRLGMLVMDENRHLGDTYLSKTPLGTETSMGEANPHADSYLKKNPLGTNLSDLATMIQRDRNHPSVILWSMCNEENIQGTPEAARLFSEMRDVVYCYDRTRPVTSAMNGGFSVIGIAGIENVIGVNYEYKELDAIHQRFPDKPMFGSEDANIKNTRGQYRNDRTNGWVSCYKLSEDGWLPIIARPFMAGAFVWTGIDYKGEPNPFGWPDVGNNTGLMDACGFPKDKYYYFQSCWSDRPMVHLMPDSWNWPGREGKAIRVIAFSNARQVELFLNGHSLGIKDMPRDRHLEWPVAYQPGQLLARAYVEGKLVATDEVQTTGVPARIELAPERTTLGTDGEDTVVVAVSVVDAEGRVVPEADNHIRFQLSGGGQILGVGNGNPSDHDPDRAKERNAFHGHCIAVVQARTQATEFKLTATSPGLMAASVTFRADSPLKNKSGKAFGPTARTASDDTAKVFQKVAR